MDAKDWIPSATEQLFAVGRESWGGVGKVGIGRAKAGGNGVFFCGNSAGCPMRFFFLLCSVFFQLYLLVLLPTRCLCQYCNITRAMMCLVCQDHQAASPRQPGDVSVICVD